MKENLYTNKKRWKWVLAMVALLIVGASLWYTNFLVKSIAEQETNQVKMWAAAMEQHAGMMKSTEEFFGKVSEQEQMRVDLLAHAYRQVLDFSNNENTAIYLEIIKNNISIPLVITDDAGNIMFSNNLPDDQKEKKTFDAEMRKAYSKFKPIKINPGFGQIQWLYYNESLIYTELKAVLEGMIDHFLEEITLNAVGAPVIITNADGTKILSYGNLDSVQMTHADYVEHQLEVMRSSRDRFHEHRQGLHLLPHHRPCGADEILPAHPDHRHRPLPHHRLPALQLGETLRAEPGMGGHGQGDGAPAGHPYLVAHGMG